jgi:concanavalin A-like lectin/glucanase superfamily protein
MKMLVKTTVLTALVAGLGVPLHAQTRNITNQLVVHLSFDNTLNDDSGRTNNGTYVGTNGLVTQLSSPTYAPGKLGNAFQFTTAADGSLIEFVTLGYPNDLKFGTGSWSVSFWINATTNTHDPAMISNKNWWDSGNPGWGVFFQGGGNFRVQMTDAVTSSLNIDSKPPETIRDGTWHHIAVTFTAGVSRNIYLDGNLIESVANPITGGVDTDTQVNGVGDSYAVNIGQDGTGAYNNSTANPPPPLATGNAGVYGAKIDDVGIWARALSGVEVANIYNFAQLGTNLYNVPDVHTPVIVTFNPLSGSAAVLPNIPTTAIIVNQDSAVNTSTLQLSVDGTVVPTTLVANGATNTITYTQPYLFAPGTVHTNKLTFLDNSTPTPNRTTQVNVYTIAPWTNIYLPTPLYFENFDELAVDTNPPATPYSVNWHGTGWIATNCTDTVVAGWDILNDKSDAYLDWQVVTMDIVANSLDYGTAILNTYGPIVVNGAVVTVLGSNNIAYAVSDPRSGSQDTVLFTSDYNLTGKSNIYVAYYSMYTQNQDDIAALEYSIDQGATWLPVVYMLDACGDPLPDVLTNADGSIDASNSLATVYSDVAVCNGQGGYYGYFIGVDQSLWAGLGPFISGRCNDDQKESHRVEKYRLPMADGQAHVRLRFVQAGTCSWDWGIDNLGIYSIPPTPPLQITGITRSGNSITVNWNGTGGNFSGLQRATSLSSPINWKNINGTIGQSTYTETTSGGAAYYRAVRF